MVARHAPGVDVAEVIDDYRAHLVRAVDAWTRMKDRDAALDDDAGTELAIEFAIGHLRACIRWLDTASSALVEPSP